MGFGGMLLSLRQRPPEEEACRILHAVLDAGVNFLDTADVYCIDDSDIGHNERLFARVLRERPRDRVWVGTKGGLRRPGGRWTTEGSPKHLKAACEASLRALGVDRIDLYQLHAPDPEVPFDASVGALAELRAEGKIALVGLSNVTVEQIELAQRIVPIATVQNRCNPHDRQAWSNGVIPYCEAQNITFLPYSPVGGSYRKHTVAQDPTLNAIGAAHGVSPFRVALAWLLAKSPIILPIPGASRMESAIDSAAAMHLSLTGTDLAKLNAAFPT